MASKIKKRSGEQVDFNFDKIVTAVCSAFESCDKKCPATFKSILNQNINRFKTAATVEKIQDLIEDLLLSCGYIDIYKHFSSYRAKRLMMRELKQAEVYKSIVRTEQNDITNDNANQNAETAAGMMYKFGAEGSKAFARAYLLPAKFRDLMDEGYIHLHDFDYYAMGGLNCAQIPMDKILSGGIKSGHGSARPPQRIETASFLMMIALETTQNEMFGGQGIPAFDFYLAPFVKLTYQQEIEKIAETLQLDPEKTSYYLDAEIKEYEPNTGDDIMDLALKRTVNRVYQSLESFVHNANAIHSRGGNQTVFSSINYGTDTSPEGRCIIKQLLRTTMKGVGDGETAIFPIQIMKMKEGINKNPGDPNYDLYEMSWKVTARRFFPNYLNLDASFYQNDNWNPDDPLRYIYEPATMGALASKEHLYVKINDKIYDVSIKDLFEYCKTGELNARPAQIFHNKQPLDTITGNRHIQEKSDITPGSGVYAITYLPEDITYIGSSSNVCRRLAEHKSNIKLTGKIDGGFNAADHNSDHYKFEVLEYTDDYKDTESRYIEKIPNVNFRGSCAKYYKLTTTKYGKLVSNRPNFRQDHSYKQELINTEDKDIKVFDRNNQWTKIKHIFKNDKHNTPLMMHIYYMEHDKEFCLACTEDHPLFNGKGFTRADHLKIGDMIYRADGMEMPITKISWHSERIDSYDIGTVSGSFVGSDIIMHNCRTSVYNDIYNDYPTTIGRGNLSFTTINLPMIALDVAIADGYLEKTKDGYEHMGNGTDPGDRFHEFMVRLEEMCDIVAEQLMERFDTQAKTKAYQYPLLMSGLYMGSENLKPEMEIAEVIRHGTLSIGFVGLAEALYALMRYHHAEDKMAQEFGLRAVELIHDKCKMYTDKWGLNFAAFATPAESVAGKLEKITEQKYGKIPGVTDRDYFTNSNHVPVWYHCTPSEKAAIEGPYHKLTTGGHIFYVEADADIVKNPKAVDDVNRLAWKNDMGYNAINHTTARCPQCNHEYNGPASEAPSKCPVCGAKMDTLARITGYLSSTSSKWNMGKKAELKDRITHL